MENLTGGFDPGLVQMPIQLAPDIINHVLVSPVLGVVLFVVLPFCQNGLIPLFIEQHIGDPFGGLCLQGRQEVQGVP